MRPSDFSLPAKFTEYRPGQLQALERLEKSQARWIIIQGPTGCGKSLIPATLQRMKNTRMLYIVRTKQLEDQLANDFPYAQVLKGRANYPTYLRASQFPTINTSLCTKRGEHHCQWCCTGEDADEGKCTAYRECPYYMAKQRALTADLSVLNISLMLYEANYVGGFSGWPWITYDEADTLEGSLMSFAEFRVPKRLTKLLNIPPPERKTKEEAWVNWAAEIVRPALTERLRKMQGEWSVENIKEEEELTRALAKLDFFLGDIEYNPWVYSPDGEYVLKPVFVAKHASNTLWRHGERALLMSATIISPRQLCRDLGIPASEMEFIDLKSEFDPKRRPVYYIPSARMSHKSKSFAYPQMVKGIDESLSLYPDKKVLIHAVSTELAKYIYEHTKHKTRMIAYGFNGISREKALTLFKSSPSPRVLVAQSMDRGVDLPDDVCRVILVAKVPYLDLSDKQVSKRVYASKDGKMWYRVQTWRTLVQMCGRGMRHAQDSCIVEIHDAQFGERLWKEHRELAPGWWREALIIQGDKALESARK